MSDIEKNYLEPEAADEVAQSAEVEEVDAPAEEGVRSSKYDR